MPSNAVRGSTFGRAFLLEADENCDVDSFAFAGPAVVNAAPPATVVLRKPLRECWGIVYVDDGTAHSSTSNNHLPSMTVVVVKVYEVVAAAREGTKKEKKER